MSRIIALQEPSDAGKTRTLIQVFKDLQAKYPTATVQRLDNKKKDIKVILWGVNGKIVGIESQGDPNSRLEKSLANFLEAPCDIIFCACRTSGMTVNWIKALSPKYSIHFEQKERVMDEHEQTKANSSMATRLIELAEL